MLIKIIKHLFLFLMICILQLAVIPNLPDKINCLNIIIVVIVFILFFININYAIIYSIAFGLFLDIYSPAWFGANLLALFFVVYVINFAFNHILTNKSFYTLLGLSFVATLVYNVVLLIYKLLYFVFFAESLNNLQKISFIWANNLFWQLILNLCLVMIVFIIAHYFTRKFKTIFIDTTRT